MAARLRAFVVGVMSVSACSKTQASGTKQLELEGIRVEVPAAWDESPADQHQRLVAASRRRDPAAEVQLVAVGPTGVKAPSVGLVVIRHSVEYSRGADARRMSRDAITAVRDGAAARGIEQTATSACSARHCSASFSLDFGEVSTHSRSQFWKADGRMVEVGCLGADAATVQRCELPAPPANADPVPSES